jgi:hypothetical protein
VIPIADEPQTATAFLTSCRRAGVASRRATLTCEYSDRPQAHQRAILDAYKRTAPAASHQQHISTKRTRQPPSTSLKPILTANSIELQQQPPCNATSASSKSHTHHSQRMRTPHQGDTSSPPGTGHHVQHTHIKDRSYGEESSTQPPARTSNAVDHRDTLRKVAPQAWASANVHACSRRKTRITTSKAINSPAQRRISITLSDALCRASLT